MANYVGMAWGIHGQRAIQVSVCITFAVALPAIALSGGQYVSDALHWPLPAAHAIAAMFFVVSASLNTRGILFTSRIQNLLTFLTYAILMGTALLAWQAMASLSVPSVDPDLGATANALPHASVFTSWQHLGSVFGLIFFAFIGWEMLSFTSAEFRRPERDFPRALILSYGLVMALYLVMAWTLMHCLPPTDPRLAHAP